MTRKTLTIGALAAALLAGAALAASDPSPYSGLEGRGIKALSPEETRGLLGGEGMALSLAAELNGYPGPRHVLELADRLGLDDAQRTQARALEREMKASAVALGRAIVALEAELDRVFREGAADRAAVERLAGEIAAKRGALRAVHLQAHLAMHAAMQPGQRARYMALRGYGGPHGHGAPSQHRRHH